MAFRIENVPGQVRLLVCAATRFERAAFLRPEEEAATSTDDVCLLESGIVAATTGVGIPATFQTLWPLVRQFRPARILNIGIAGAYPSSGRQIGELVMGWDEIYGDLGMELPEEPGFTSLRDTAFSPALYRDPLPLVELPEFDAPEVLRGRGCTVNICAGTERTGWLRERLFGVDFETMEGAAVAQIGQSEGVPVCELRAVSNRAGQRDMRPENIRRALENLKRHLLACRAKETA
jgi:futalosine hydrolase